MSPEYPRIQDEDFEPILDLTEVDWSEVAGQYPKLAELLGRVPDGVVEISDMTALLVRTEMGENGTKARTVARCDGFSGRYDEDGDPVAESICEVSIGPDKSVAVLSRWGGYGRSENFFHPGDAKAVMMLATAFFEQFEQIREASPEKFIPVSQE